MNNKFCTKIKVDDILIEINNGSKKKNKLKKTFMKREKEKNLV